MFPVISLILVNVLIPDVRQTESIAIESNATEKDTEQLTEEDTNMNSIGKEESIIEKKTLSLSHELDDHDDRHDSDPIESSNDSDSSHRPKDH